MEKILIVDDEPSNLDSYNNLLTSAGYGVITAVDGKNGIERYNTEKPDLVLIDVMMPGIDGYETARLMRQDIDFAYIPIILISPAANDDENRVNALGSGSIDFLIKPVGKKELLSKISSSLRMKKLYDELYATRSILQKSEAKFRTILETMQEGYFEIDRSGSMTFFNDSTCAILGYPREKLMGTNIADHTTPKTKKLFQKKISEMYLTGSPLRIEEFEIERGDGSIGMLEVSASLMQNENSMPAGISCIMRDVTDKRKAERDILIKSLAMERSINAIAIMDVKTICTFANNSFFLMWGYDGKDEVLGKSILDFCHPDNRDDFVSVMDVLWEIGNWVGELALMKKDNSQFFVILSATIIKNEEEETIGIIMSFVDITLRKKVDYSLKESKDALSLRNKMIERDLQIARTALGEIIPREAPRVESVNVDFRYYPMETLGGDFFCFYPYAGDVLGVFICDISGHGVASSLFLTLLKSITDRLSLKYGDSPSDFITRLNLELMGNMSSFFITGIYGLFTRSGTSGEVLFSYANGAHPGPVLVRKNGEIKLHSGKSTLIGISSDISFKTNTIVMGNEDRLFLYTDGLPETANSLREMIGFEYGLLELFKKSHRLTLGENIDSIVDKVGNFRNGARITDDLLIIGFEAV